MIRIFRFLMTHIAELVCYGCNLESNGSDDIIAYWLGKIILAFGLVLFFIVQPFIYAYYWLLILIFRHDINETKFTNEKEEWCLNNKIVYYAFRKQFMNSKHKELLALTEVLFSEPAVVDEVRFLTKLGAMAYKLRWDK